MGASGELVLSKGWHDEDSNCDRDLEKRPEVVKPAFMQTQPHSFNRANGPWLIAELLLRHWPN